MTSVPTTTLAAGAVMPLVGFGTHPLRGDAARDAVLTALEVGYRSVDTATRYRNEDAVGAALAATSVPRDEIFVTTKLPPDAVGLEREHLDASLQALGVDQIDLWLMHWPPGGTAGVGTFRRMVEAREQGLVKAIGVSNYRLALMDELKDATGHYPEVVQLQWSPVHFSPRFLEKCAERGIVVGAHSPFRSARLDDPVLTRIADAHGVTVNQVIVRWNVQHGVAVVPKSANRERMATNLDVLGFELSDDELAAIDGLSELE
ncbi:aldo/keto reductase [Schumannella luteola]|uniref:Diketogulonate reductase-like aldo/keto reductase n=1 Tax=Schumannella luteola TaxID=472059 RepID=A0A852YKD8_9MICO|nr:diketogulonate reductase-like aldo/keto reductase [Schumannella luteola]